MGCQLSSRSHGMTKGSCGEGCADRHSGGIVHACGTSGSLLQRRSPSKGPRWLVQVRARGRTCACRCWAKHSHHLAATFQRIARCRKGDAAQRGGGNVRICRTSGGLLQRGSASKGPGKMVRVRARGRTCACRCRAEHSRHRRSSFDLTPTMPQGGSPGLICRETIGSAIKQRHEEPERDDDQDGHGLVPRRRRCTGTVATKSSRCRVASGAHAMARL